MVGNGRLMRITENRRKKDYRFHRPFIFVRQILGWREYMRAVYLAVMPGYEDVNTFKHERDLPSFFWDAKTDLNCLHQSLKPVVAHAHNHHIQRLMVLGNYATLFEISPQQTSD